jgi:hypothetical protein
VSQLNETNGAPRTNVIPFRGDYQGTPSPLQTDSLVAGSRLYRRPWAPPPVPVSKRQGFFSALTRILLSTILAKRPRI